MRNKKITTRFFNRPTLAVAKDLLGKYLVRRIPSTLQQSSGQAGSGQAAKIISGKIIETEAYCGPHDKACHASRGRTKRTEVMFGKPGLAYVYMIYGMYYCLNIVTEKAGYPAAVLIRSIDFENCDGPGKICRNFKIDKILNGADVCSSKDLWIEDRGGKVRAGEIKKSPRIGVDYAGEYKDKSWRFYIMPKK